MNGFVNSVEIESDRLIRADTSVQTFSKVAHDLPVYVYHMQLDCFALVTSLVIRVHKLESGSTAHAFALTLNGKHHARSYLEMAAQPIHAA